MDTLCEFCLPKGTLGSPIIHTTISSLYLMHINVVCDYLHGFKCMCSRYFKILATVNTEYQRSFTRNKYLLSNIMIPTDEKLYQYQCNVCDKSFSSNSKVKAHMVTINEEKGYQCSVCEKLFFQPMAI